MSTTTALFSRSNLDFILYQVLKVENLIRFNYYQDHNKESFGMAIDVAAEIAERILWPAFASSDQNLPVLENGQVVVHEAIDTFVKAYSKAGLIGATFSYEQEGSQLPKTIGAALEFVLCASSNSFIMYTDLAKGIANLLDTFGTETQKAKYLTNVLSGKWLGTMCLTEADSGSSLATIITKATPNTEGSYHIKGQKIFISAGDHNVSDNIIHLVLARIEGAPEGVKGISLFIVPKKNENGESNGVLPIAIYHKMGQKATPAMHLSFGEKESCKGYLLGEANRGLNQMFVMMDGARLSVGAMGASMASAAYSLALQYAQERKQGNSLKANTKKEPVPIIQHPDVRRMLLQQKAFVEGTLCFVLQCYTYLDIQKATEDSKEKEKYTQLLNLLTPVAKTYGAEHGLASVNQALQVLGGYGYTKDFPLEQLARDVRILPIYEGTTGIHALGLLGRQVLANNGKNLEVWYAEVLTAIEVASSIKNLEKYAKLLQEEIIIFKTITASIEKLSTEFSPEEYLADASLYMEYFGTLNIGWQWLNQGIAAQKQLDLKEGEVLFYESKLKTMQFFYTYEMSRLKGLAESLLNPSFLNIFDANKEILI